MFIKIETDSDIPIYTQLANGLIEGVANGSLQPGDQLPSVRSLAADLGVNMHTVNKAYRELDGKGIVKIIPKSGAVVNVPLQAKAARSRIEEYMKPVIAEALAVGTPDEEIILMVRELINTIKEVQE
ncbi:GntR family transcriptional regulator [Sporosarcina sp. G11-34]|uniref:GntR family transcriptional regulator n=1 Tax=Sporosarcina sp. G11-34 TaxID=2849605 RepID=UPI0022A9D020|nr:GntR family transcriptional regulator [Sporosarcina sp. G11-34]MCZ2258023.1 GntR family transcriptional regulator [Sporosarcina sp. G11-34]